jgi:hypothetical protein
LYKASTEAVAVLSVVYAADASILFTGASNDTYLLQDEEMIMAGIPAQIIINFDKLCFIFMTI